MAMATSQVSDGPTMPSPHTSTTRGASGSERGASGPPGCGAQLVVEPTWHSRSAPHVVPSGQEPSAAQLIAQSRIAGE
jgi:hypothetical protein